MKQKILLSLFTICIISFFEGCSNDEYSKELKELTTTSHNVIALQDSTILPIKGTHKNIKHLKTRANYYDYDLSEELEQLDEIPIYLQVQGNSDERRFLSVTNKGKEVTIEKFKDKSLDQQFYIKILPATAGIPYLIYSKKTNTLIRIGTYKNKPEVSILYAGHAPKEQLFGASWDIKRGKYSRDSYIIENTDFPMLGNNYGGWGNTDVYYNAITADGNKVLFSKYNNSPKQEFQIIPVEEFKIESITFNIDNTATLTQEPELVYSDRFVNNSPIEQKHTFSISKTYKETSSFTKKTSYSLSIKTDFSVKIPIIADGKISTTLSSSKEFTYGKSEEHTITINRDYPIIIPANYIGIMRVTLYKYNMDVEYIATCVGMVSGRKIKIKGRWKGVDVEQTEAVLDLTPTNNSTSGKRTVKIPKDMLESNKVIKIN